MTADSGFIHIWFSGCESDMKQLSAIMDITDRQNLFSCGLSWLDDMDSQWEAESEYISYDSIEATREFLVQVLTQLPRLQFEGTMEHCWPTLPRQVTRVTFSSEDGQLRWEETVESDDDEPYLSELYGMEEDDDDGEEIPIPLTPYD